MNISRPQEAPAEHGETTAQLVRRIEAFCRETGMDERKLAKEATGDPRKIARIREEKATQRSIREVENFMARYRGPRLVGGPVAEGAPT